MATPNPDHVLQRPRGASAAAQPSFASPPDQTRRKLALGISTVIAGSCCALPLLSGCGDGNGGQVLVSSAQQAQLEAVLPQFDAWASATLARSAVPGMAVAVVQGERVAHMKGFGVRRAGSSDAVDADTVFPLASVSKPMASTVIAATLRHRAEWDTRIGTLDPGFALSDPLASAELTLRDLLSHRSGLAGAAGDLLEEIGYSSSEVLQRLRHVPLWRPFRQFHQYANMPFSEAGFALARSLGMDWASLCETLLYAPLGMSSTSSRHADFLARANRVHSHVLAEGRYVERYDRDADVQAPAASVSSSVRDLSVWVRLHLANGRQGPRQLIDGDVLAATREAVISTAAPGSAAPARAFYGLGWNVATDDAGRVRISHSGAFNRGAATNVSMMPAEQLGIVVLTNGAPVGLPEALARGFFDLMFNGMISRDHYAASNAVFIDFLRPRLILANDYSTAAQTISPPLPLSAYTGRYSNPFYGPLEISHAGNTLSMSIGPWPVTRTLVHWNANVFIDASPGTPVPAPGTVDMAPGDLDIHYLGGLLFSIGSDGRATAVRFEELDQHGEGSFMRVA
ncbi:MAG: serine hydrolase [Janthinobacterium lividum]